MKKSISLIVLLSLVQILGLVQSCNPCGSSGPEVYNLRSISGSLFRITEKEIIPDFQSSVNLPIASYQPYEVGEGFIHFDSLGIALLTDIYASAPKTDKGNIFNSAFACSPAVDFGAISDVSVVSSESYERYQAGELLNEIILIRTEYDAFGTLLSEFDSEVDYLLDRHNNMLITFALPPTVSKTHNLTIIITSDNGDVFVEEINGVSISN